MWRLAVKNTLARRGRLALTLLAVVLGVTFVTGSLVLTDTSRQLLDAQFRTATAGVDVTVRGAAAFDSAMGVEVERDPLPPQRLERVRREPGVAEALPIARGQGLLVVGGEPVVPAGASLLSSWSPAPFGAFPLRAGRAPTGADEVVVDAATAAARGIGLGDRVTVQARLTRELTVVGTAGFGTAAGPPDSTAALVSLPTAQEMLRLGDAISEIAVVAADAVPATALRDRLGRALGATAEVVTSRDTAAASAAAAGTQLEYLRLMLLALAAAALLVGAFLIANTFAIVITQRTRELAVLRAGGATGRQVVGSVLGEASLVGVAASVLGIVLGVAAGHGLRGLAGAFGINLPDGDLVLAPRTVAVAFAVGVVVTVAAAVGPARRAARVAPVTALRDAVPTGGTGRARTVTGVLLTALGVGGSAAVAAAGGGLAALGAGALATLGGLVLLGPALAPRAARVLGRPLDAVGVAGRLARQSAARTPRRTAATATALGLGLLLISFMTVLATSVKTSIASGYRETVTADFIIESGRNEMLGGLPASVHHHVAALPEVAAASRVRYGHWKDGQETGALTAVDPATLPQVAAVRMVAGDLAALGRGGVVLAAQTAQDRGLKVGDTLAMTFARTGTQRLPVVGLLRDRDAQALSTAYLISLDTYARHFREDVDASVYVALRDGVEPAAAQRALAAAVGHAPTAQVRDQAEAVANRTATLDQILGLVTVLLALAVGIALLGITNTLALSIIERTREVGLLRAVGMTRGQLRWMVRAEAVLVAALATVVGTGLGVGFAAAAVRVLGAGAPIALSLPVPRLLAVVGVAVVAGLLAGLLPARRAARLEPLAAIAG